MEDLDVLQMEMESLLNSVVIRSLNLQREIAGMTEKVSQSPLSRTCSIYCSQVLKSTFKIRFTAHLTR